MNELFGGKNAPTFDGEAMSQIKSMTLSLDEISKMLKDAKKDGVEPD
jgi:hypothetical protein